MTNPYVSIIIPTYNRKEDLKKCVDSVLQLNYPRDKYEIIVVDDGSTDGTYEFLKRLENEEPNLRVFSQENKGPASARNLGIKNAKGEILFFTDDDCLVGKDWINQHLKYYSDKRIGGVGGTLWPIEMSFVEELKIGSYLDEYTQFMEINSAESGKGLATCNCSYRREVFDEVGLFDESFPTAAGEDIELSKRALLNGYHLIKDPKIRVHHLKTDTLKTLLKTSFKRRQGITREKKKHKKLWENRKSNYNYFKRLLSTWRRYCYVREHIAGKKVNINIVIKFLFLMSCLKIVGKLGDIYYLHEDLFNKIGLRWIK